ncbi:glycosyltransferase [Noviherbaspirillum cavernae]|uniref:Glycosyltransferase n=2 Tax=Noviherbaspirillum cavernae TaxID=2320862 RepID=A0A418X3M8_9BURK|nr:glycosyltransferase [Noviherbaspirillum cavernae]
MVKRVLMIAYHYPPQHGSSGIQRTLKFSRYLPEFGWDPVVLSARPAAYPSVSNDQLVEIPSSVHVHRAFALDASRHLSIRGRYLRAMALPDRWSSWWLGAVPSGLRLIREHRPDVIWSTYPIATAHLIGHALHRLSGIPWVADFRDPMTDEGYPADAVVRGAYRWVERRTILNCSHAVFTTPGAANIYRARFPHLPASRFRVIENGYDEENFSGAAALPANAPQGEKPFVLLHSGIIYPSERDPRPLFEAVAALVAQGDVSSRDFRLVLRAAHHEELLRQLAHQHGIADIVTLLPPIPYREALSEMLAADGLLILQAASCNGQIPAKLYEYLRAQRPILALTDPAGDTAATLRNAGIDTIARLDSRDCIMAALRRFIDMARQGAAPMAAMDKVLANSRKARTQELANLLDQVAGAS